MYLVEQIRSIDPIRDAIIGQEYLVPCLYSDEHSWPIIPLPHKDPEFGSDWFHCHFDFRFFTKAELSMLDRENKTRHNLVIRLYEFKTLSLSKRVCLRKPGAELRSCRGNVIRNILENDESNLNCLKVGVCPHKGHHFSKDSVKPDGVFECPLHGLKFKMSTGKLIKCKDKK